MSSVQWRPFDEVTLRALGLRAEDVRLLSGRGLPDDSNRMFVRNSLRELEAREFPQVGPSVFLGDFEDGVNSYWLSITEGSVWMKKGYEDSEGDVVRVNSSLSSLQDVLKIWEGFIFSEVYEEDESYDSLVERTVSEAANVDSEIFEDEESWWSRVFEEIELGSIAPE